MSLSLALNYFLSSFSSASTERMKEPIPARFASTSMISIIFILIDYILSYVSISVKGDSIFIFKYYKKIFRFVVIKKGALSEENSLKILYDSIL